MNVLVRAHYLPLFSRLGAYDPAVLDRLAYEGRDRALFEYWGHEASLLPVSAYPLLRWRMERAARGLGIYGQIARFGRRRRAFVEEVLAEVTERGPLAASELSRRRPRRAARGGAERGQAGARVALLGRAGDHRDPPELPAHLRPARARAARGRPRRARCPTEDEAQRALLRTASRALGVATARDLADYFRLNITEARPRLAELVEAGDLVPARVEGWRAAAYLHPQAPLPAPRAGARPARAVRPAGVGARSAPSASSGSTTGSRSTRRRRCATHGYYVLPFLLGDRLVARVDLKADRDAPRPPRAAAHVEPGVAAARVARPLARELATMAEWLGLDGVEVGRRGNLGRALRAASD